MWEDKSKDIVQSRWQSPPAEAYMPHAAATSTSLPPSSLTAP